MFPRVLDYLNVMHKMKDLFCDVLIISLFIHTLILFQFVYVSMVLV